MKRDRCRRSKIYAEEVAKLYAMAALFGDGAGMR